MKIGFIGLGIMGEAMSANIAKKHNGEVYTFDVVPEKTVPGTVRLNSALEVAERSDVIITMVPKSEHSRAVCDAVLPAMKKGKIYIDMSTIDPSASVELSEKVKATGAQFADAPVVKSRPAAEAGKLGIYVGCDEELFDVIKPVLSYMGENIIRMGGNGMGLVMKICHNTLVAEIQNGVNETLCLARKYGVSVDDFKTAISYGGGQNFYLDGQAENIRNRNWKTAFSLENMNKDLGIAAGMSAEKGFRMPGMENARRVYSEGMEAGIGREDFRATYKIVSGEME
ncbi:MAG: NAD(P)-dependent oxidoreductase [Oscillospiraceae bacterium]|nr:NAD(P)-dependent oxidoreductase [Oscillospiraceae bacterium]